MAERSYASLVMDLERDIVRLIHGVFATIRLIKGFRMKMLKNKEGQPLMPLLPWGKPNPNFVPTKGKVYVPPVFGTYANDEKD